MKYKIYRLVDPKTNEIRYIGKTIQTLKSRLKKHLNAKDKSHRVNWINSLKNDNLIPHIELICETDSHDHCNELEAFFIRKYRDMGFSLVNMTEGGDGSIGFNHTEKSKIKMSVATKKRMRNPEVIKNLSKKAKKRWDELSEEKKEKNILNQPNRRDIHQYDMNLNYIKSFKSLREIERELGFFRANIKPCLDGKFKQAYGFKWFYEIL